MAGGSAEALGGITGAGGKKPGGGETFWGSTGPVGEGLEPAGGGSTLSGPAGPWGEGLGTGINLRLTTPTTATGTESTAGSEPKERERLGRGGDARRQPARSDRLCAQRGLPGGVFGGVGGREPGGDEAGELCLEELGLLGGVLDGGTGGKGGTVGGEGAEGGF